MKRTLTIIVSVILLLGSFGIIRAHLDHRLYDLQNRKEKLMSEVISELKKSRVILVGEHHTSIDHHFGQLNVIQSLKEAGVQVAIGLEMFRDDSQQALDQWVAGTISEEQFEAIYYDNWNYPWPVYRMIFDYARQEKIPMIGLNVPREITRQVSQGGFNSLSEEQRGKLKDVSCRVDKEYMDYIKRAFGGHAHGQINFTYFCEAQMVWDTAMAIYALEYLDRNPASRMVILTGSVHAWKRAIPRQIETMWPDVTVSVILPALDGKEGKALLTAEDADYLVLL
jgi:uncharacterized iron-regulated protein